MDFPKSISNRYTGDRRGGPTVNTGAGFLLIIGGLLLLYSIITGKFGVIESAFYQLFELQQPAATNSSPGPDAAASVQDKINQIIPAIGPGSQPAPITLPDIFKIVIPDYTKGKTQ